MICRGSKLAIRALVAATNSLPPLLLDTPTRAVIRGTGRIVHPQARPALYSDLMNPGGIPLACAPTDFADLLPGESETITNSGEARAAAAPPRRPRGAETRRPLGASRGAIRRAGERRVARATAIGAAVLIGILVGPDVELLKAMQNNNHPAQQAITLNQVGQNDSWGRQNARAPAATARLPGDLGIAQAGTVTGSPPPGGTPLAGEVSRVAILRIAASSTAQVRAAPPSGGTLAERYKRAQSALSEARSKAAAASAERDRLSAEELALQQSLLTTAAKVQQLERTATENAAELDRLNSQITRAKAGLARDRSDLVLAIAVLQRIHANQRDGVLMTPDDAMRSMRARLQIGATLTPLSDGATRLADQLKTLTNLQNAAADRQAETARDQAALNDTRDNLDRRIAENQAQQESLATQADELQKVMGDIGRETGSLKALMDRIAGLRTAPNAISPRVKAVGPGSNSAAELVRGGLRPPVVGRSTPGDPAGPGVTPGAAGPSGLWYESAGRGEAVAPADSEVVFAGPYQKLGQVLILELAGGYHLALAGLGRIDVRVGDLVLAGEPVGSLPEGKSAPLYMELRRNGKVVELAPWVSADIRKAKGT